MVRKFVVRVNGKEYIVEVEELGIPAQAMQQPQILEQPKPVVQQQVQSAKPTQPEIGFIGAFLLDCFGFCLSFVL